ncbi:hypothetical protein BCR41DRAFT_418814 [Lobosporangium transversale]|uniref:Ndc10 domain-containing protein n=1 Tax=Lobosporangium transversale TaxID=64571 RepID=A0A1Y2GZS3_9FUNG|nr:hypothetical protein BCR41DRAFT_418814 [Lobosporangium transversale]ORZ27810.1 hypothetical protein BCR41DRAFT_418814 [Lobosporangium transversale]|eukprot:XP_021885513.1 hypothetical protein BCR41DRAFT_418814 [Lobosporangium transversale]
MEKEFGFFSKERMLPGSSLGSATVSTMASSNVLTAAPSLDVEIPPLPLSPSLKRSRGRPKNASQAPQQQLIKSRSQLHPRPYQSLPAEPAVRLDQSLDRSIPLQYVSEYQSQDPPDAEERFVDDMNDCSGIKPKTLASYQPTYRLWKAFCEKYRERYADKDGRALYLVDSQDKVVCFFREVILKKTILKRTKPGADFRTHLAAEEDSSAIHGASLVESMSSNCAERNDVSWDLSPSQMKLLQTILIQHIESLHTHVVRSGGRREAGCTLRDSYTPVQFHSILMGLWTKERHSPNMRAREYDTNYRDMFCLTARHNMLLRDEDLRNLNFADCFSTIITQRTEGGQQPIGLTFKINKGKTNKNNENWYACALRHEDGSDHEKSKSLQIKDVVKSINSSDFVQLKVIPGNKERTKSLASQSTYRTVEALYDQHNVNSPRKTHGGRHAGTIEAHRLGISQDDIKAGGRWTAKRGRMESFYLPCLPSRFALGMAGFYSKSFFLLRNSIRPSNALQLLVFPWIEDIFGKNNKWWRDECLKEMDEVDPNSLPNIRAVLGSTVAVEATQVANSSSKKNIYSENEISTCGFLRLLVRCRRIILQDAAFRLHYSHHSRILEDDIFKSPLFLEFQKEMSYVVEHPEPNIVQKYNAIIPEIAEGFKDISRLSQMHYQLLQQQLKQQQQQQQQLQLELRQLKEQLNGQQQQHQLELCQQQQQYFKYIQLQQSRMQNWMNHSSSTTAPSSPLLPLASSSTSIMGSSLPETSLSTFSTHQSPQLMIQPPAKSEASAKKKRKRDIWIPYAPQKLKK